MELSAGTIIGGKYRLERHLARGGMGALWVARHLGLGAPLVVKLLDPQFAHDENYRIRFEREARASAALRSPHIVHVHDYGIHEQIPFIAMELLEGEDLGQRLRRVRRFSIPDTWKLLVQIAKGLRRAHEAGIVHRDLKPANLFLARADDDEVLKILDFGIAKETNPLSEATKAGEMVGSPHYMSPEQVRCERDIDHRADLWSLGVILFRMLTGVLPFPGTQFGPVIAKVLMEPIPVPSQLASELPPSVDAFFLRALARERPERFSSVNELVEAFGAIVAGVAPGEGSARTPVAGDIHPALVTNPDSGSLGPPTPTSQGSMMLPLPRLGTGSEEDRLTAPAFDADAEIAVPPGATWRRNRAAWWGAAAAVLVVSGALVAILAGGPESPPPEAASQPPRVEPSPAANLPASTSVAAAPIPPPTAAPTPPPTASADPSAKPSAKAPPTTTAKPTGAKRKWF